MSRTDVHRPVRVQETDPYARKHFKRSQVWAHQQPELWPLRNLCGCNMCTGRVSRKYRNRRIRTQWRQDRQALLAGGQMRPPRNLDCWI